MGALGNGKVAITLAIKVFVILKPNNYNAASSSALLPPEVEVK